MEVQGERRDVDAFLRCVRERMAKEIVNEEAQVVGVEAGEAGFRIAK